MPDSRSLALLVIDDDGLVRNALASALDALCGWTILVASDPAAAAQHYTAVDVVMSDWNMPAGGGARVIAESPKPVLIYSAEIGPIPHPWRLRKPASLEAIRNAILEVRAHAMGANEKGPAGISRSPAGPGRTC